MTEWIVKDGHGNPYLNERGEWSERQCDAYRFPTVAAARAAIQVCLRNKQTLDGPRVLALKPSRAALENAFLREALRWSATNPCSSGREHASAARHALKFVALRTTSDQPTKGTP